MIAIGLVLALGAWWRFSPPPPPGKSLPGNRPPEGNQLAESLPTRVAPTSPLPEIAASPYLNTTPDAKYVGSTACAECHTGEHESFQHTAHALSFAKVEPAAEPAVGQFRRDQPGWHYQVYHQQGGVHHRQVVTDLAGKEAVVTDRPVHYRVGSGRFARTYLSDLEGILLQSPITWYETAQEWNLSPGFETGLHGSFSRNVSADCLFCHSGRTSNEPASEFRVQIQEMKISCERCHGPGSLHVARQQGERPALAGEVDLTIVNPRDLPRDLAEAVCQQCHLQSESEATVRGRRRQDFRPGLRWTDFVVNYALDNDPAKMTVTGHVQQMRISRCYAESDTLTCLTCHNPHHEPAELDRREHYRARCLECHAEPGCKLEIAERTAKNENDCAACHMPRSPTEVPHVAFTHHRIGIHSDPPAKTDTAAGASLRPVLDVSHLPAADYQASLGLAYSKLAEDRTANPDHAWMRLEAERMLQEAAQAGAASPRLLATLASLQLVRGDEVAAEATAHPLLADDQLDSHASIVAGQTLSTIYINSGRLPEARQVLDQIVNRRHDAGDWALLGMCRYQDKDPDGAMKAFERALLIDPTIPGTYQDLIQLHQARGDKAAASKLRRPLKSLQMRLNPQGPE